jgi:hypothetical protein
MAKRRVGNQTANLIPDQKKLGIDPIYLSIDKMRHIIEELFDKSYSFALDRTSIGGLLAKL